MPKQAEIMAQGHVCCNTNFECRLYGSCRIEWGENIVFETVFRNIQQDWKQAEGMCDHSDVRNEVLILRNKSNSQSQVERSHKKTKILYCMPFYLYKQSPPRGNKKANQEKLACFHQIGHWITIIHTFLSSLDEGPIHHKKVCIHEQ